MVRVCSPRSFEFLLDFLHELQQLTIAWAAPSDKTVEVPDPPEPLPWGERRLRYPLSNFPSGVGNPSPCSSAPK